MVALDFDDETLAALKAQAAGEGLSVEDWVRQLVVKDRKSSSEILNDQDWEERFLALVRRHKPTHSPLDDSRESIYD